MKSFSSEEYIECKKWIAEKIQEGYSWENVASLCVNSQQMAEEFDRLQNEELIIPQTLELQDWADLVKNVQSNYTPITELYGISGGTSNMLPVPTDSGSAWVRYKNYGSIIFGVG